MTDLADVTVDTFTPFVGATIQATGPQGPIPFTLRAANAVPTSDARPETFRAPFVLDLAGPPGFHLQQGQVSLTLGEDTYNIFIVATSLADGRVSRPGPDDALLYTAHFN